MAKELCGPDKKQQEKWEIDSAVDTLVRAAEIIEDKELLKKVTAAAKDKKRAISSIADLIARREEMSMEEDSED
jgi:hypothetical protein